MHTAQAAPYPQQLLTMRTLLLAQISVQRGGTISRADAAAEHFGHPEDSRAQVATERDIEFALGERVTAEVAGIDTALARIDSGHYGQCISCGGVIAAARLDASPEAGRCISCHGRAKHRRAS